MTDSISPAKAPPRTPAPVSTETGGGTARCDCDAILSDRRLRVLEECYSLVARLEGLTALERSRIRHNTRQVAELAFFAGVNAKAQCDVVEMGQLELHHMGALEDTLAEVKRLEEKKRYMLAALDHAEKALDDAMDKMRAATKWVHAGQMGARGEEE